MNWTVRFTDVARVRFRNEISLGKISKEDIHVIKIWMEQVENDGISSAQKSSKWDDHPLEKEWYGYRSCCFSPNGRIIYWIDYGTTSVWVERITGIHDYGRVGYIYD